MLLGYEVHILKLKINVFRFIKKKDWKFIWLFQSLVSSVSGLSATRLSQRIFWLSWLLFNFIVNAYYTSYFITQIAPRKKQQPYKSLRQLLTANITLLSEAGHFQEIRQSLTGSELTPYYGQPQDINRTSALLTSTLTRLKLFRLFGSQFYKVDECLLRRTVGPLISTRKPYFRSFVTTIKRVTAAGLIQYWFDIYLHHDFLSGNRTATENYYEKEAYSALKLEELGNIFLYFTETLLFSCVVFLWEVLYFQITKPRTKVRPEIVRVYPYTD